LLPCSFRVVVLVVDATGFRIGSPYWLRENPVKSSGSPACGSRTAVVTIETEAVVVLHGHPAVSFGQQKQVAVLEHDGVDDGTGDRRGAPRQHAMLALPLLPLPRVWSGGLRRRPSPSGVQ